jgi:hypothetical protein
MYARTLTIAAITCSVFLSACADPELTALETYLAEGEEIGMEMSEAGTRFETLMNVQANVLAWTQAEKDELVGILQEFEGLEDRAQAMTPPAILQDVHPILIEAIQEMKLSVQGVADIAANPSQATAAKAAELEAHATKGEELGNEYLMKLEAAIGEEYPEMME